MRSVLVSCIAACLVVVSVAFLPQNSLLKSAIVKQEVSTSTALFAHHPQKKIIKKIVHKRPRKARLSDINRRNVNLHKCITKAGMSMNDFDVVTLDAKGLEAAMADVKKFFDVGTSSDEWWEYTPEDEDMVGFNQCQVFAPEHNAPAMPLIRQRGFKEEDDEVVTDPEAEAWFAAGINSGEEGAVNEEVPQPPARLDPNVKLSKGESYLDDFIKADLARRVALDEFYEKEKERLKAKREARVEDDA